MAITQNEIDKLQELYDAAMRLYKLGEIRMALIGIKPFLENIVTMIFQQEGYTPKEIEEKRTYGFHDILFKKYPNFYKKYTEQGAGKAYESFRNYANRASHEDFTDVSLEEVETLKNLFDWFKEYADFTVRPYAEDTYISKEGFSFSHCLRYLKVKNFQCIQEIEIQNIPLDAQFIVFTGENGYGKTSLLQAIAIGLYGNTDTDSKEFFCDNPKTYIKVEARTTSQNYYNQNSLQILVNEFLGYGNSLSNAMISMKNFAAYGASRLQLESAESMSKGISRKSPVYNLFHDDGVLRNIEFEISNREYVNGNNKFRENVISILKKIFPHIENVEYGRFERTKNGFLENDSRLIFQENGTKIISEYLSAGNKSIFAMIGDLILRLGSFNAEGIVLIDELEAHLHPKWQREFPRLLAEIFPKVQFIVTTHSAITFLGMPSNSAFYHVTSDAEKGTQVEKLDIDIENLLPNHILTSPIFGMENIKHVENVDEQKVPTSELSYDEVKKRAETQAELKELAKKFVFPKNLQKK